MIGDGPGRLIESNVVSNLGEPCALSDTSCWIRSGKVSFLWGNGYVVAAPDKVGPLDTATLLRYVDFAADNRIPYASIDGSDHAWYGGPCAPYQGADVTVPVPELDVPAVFAHARARGVRMRIWVNYPREAQGRRLVRRQHGRAEGRGRDAAACVLLAKGPSLPSRNLGRRSGARPERATVHEVRRVTAGDATR